MTPQDILNEIDAHGFTDTDLTTKLSLMNASIRNVANRQPWPWMQAVTSLTFDGTNPYPTNAPSDLRAVLKVIDTSTGKRVRYKAVDEMEEQHGSQLLDAGTPLLYYFEGSQLRFWRVPGSTQTLRARYVRRHPAVAQSDPESAILLPPDSHELVVFRTLMRLNDLEDDNDIAARFGGLFDQAYQELLDGLSVQQFDVPEHILVTDDEDYYYDL